jgi:hypothetical protein
MSEYLKDTSRCGHKLYDDCNVRGLNNKYDFNTLDGPTAGDGVFVTGLDKTRNLEIGGRS